MTIARCFQVAGERALLYRLLLYILILVSGVRCCVFFNLHVRFHGLWVITARVHIQTVCTEEYEKLPSRPSSALAQAKHEHSVNSDALPNPIEARNPAPKARTTGLHAHIAFYYLSEIRGSRILYYRRQE